jgi:hypothetical protein
LHSFVIDGRLRFRPVRTPIQLVAVVLALSALAGCGGGDDRAGTVSTPAAALPALATRPAAAGEVVVRGEASPATRGPYSFDGRYVVRFEQYAPEDPALDFAAQTPLSAQLTRRRGDPRGAVALFEAADRSGRREVEIHGRRFLDVTFGDFPWVVRFTPRSGG